jgi:hypothetical protein
MQFTLGHQLGDLGGHTVFVLFPGVDGEGHAFFAQDRRATLSVELAALGTLPPQRVTWHLPLGALVRDRSCPACGGSFNGAWLFCPWDGRHLVDPSAIPADTAASVPTDARPATSRPEVSGRRGPGPEGP